MSDGNKGKKKKTKVNWGNGFDEFWAVMEEGRNAATEAGATLFGNTDIVIQTDPNGKQGRVLDKQSIVAHEFVIDVVGVIENDKR